MLGRVITAVTVVIGAFSTASAQDVKLPEIEFGRYHALVIGNNDYQQLPKLNTAVSDATVTATLLREKCGFQVAQQINTAPRYIRGATEHTRKHARVEADLRRGLPVPLQALGFHVDTQIEVEDRLAHAPGIAAWRHPVESVTISRVWRGFSAR